MLPLILPLPPPLRLPFPLITYLYTATTLIMFMLKARL
jgi:hypothetical protein